MYPAAQLISTISHPHKHRDATDSKIFTTIIADFSLLVKSSLTRILHKLQHDTLIPGNVMSNVIQQVCSNKNYFSNPFSSKYDLHEVFFEVMGS